MTSNVMEFDEPQLAGRNETPSVWFEQIKVLASRYPSALKGMLSIFDQAIVSGTGFMTAAIIGRLTSPDELGLYYLALTIVLIVSGTQDQLVSSPYTVYSKRRSGSELSEYRGSAWIHILALTLLAILGLIVAILVCSALGFTKIRPGLWALLGAGPLLMLRDTIRRFAYADLRVMTVIPFDAVIAVTQLGGLALLGRYGKLSLFSIYAVMGAACTLACLGWFFLARPQVRFVRARYLTDWLHNWSFGKWALRTFLVGNTTPYVMLWILSFAAGAAATGVLGACTTLVGLTNVILTGLSNILTPQAAHAYVTGGAASLRRILFSTAAFLAFVLGGFCLFVLLTGDWLAVLVFGPPFAGTGAILLTLAFSMLFTSMGMVAGNGLWAIDEPQLNFVADVCCMVVTLLAAAILISSYGALGAALATMIGTLVSAVVRIITFFRHLESGDREPHASSSSAFSS